MGILKTACCFHLSEGLSVIDHKSFARETGC